KPHIHTGSSPPTITLSDPIKITDVKTAKERVGHFTLHIDSGNSFRILKETQFINGHHCGDDVRTPSTTTRQYETSPGGTWFDIWISTYWNCDTSGVDVMSTSKLFICLC